jgi:hypothetical protein
MAYMCTVAHGCDVMEISVSAPGLRHVRMSGRLSGRSNIAVACSAHAMNSAKRPLAEPSVGGA